MPSNQVDVTVVGAGPNGLAAALESAQAGLRVRLIEAAPELGGGCRTAELIESGFVHDVCAAVHPMAFASPFFHGIGLDRSLDWVVPEVSYAHALRPEVTAYAFRDVERTAEGLGAHAGVWRRMFRTLARHPLLLGTGTLGAPLGVSPRALPLLSVLAASVAQAIPLAARDRGPAGALLAGLFAHANGGAVSPATGLIGMTLGAHAHGLGWPIPRGGSGMIVAELERRLQAHGVEIVTGHTVRSLDELSDSAAILLDVTPRAFVALAGNAMNARARRAYEAFRYGPAVFKVDYTLDGPVPWLDPQRSQAGTLHMGGDAPTVSRVEEAVKRGIAVDQPFMMVSQPTSFDASRAPAGKHVLWAYAHAPAGSDRDLTDQVTAVLEAHAPGFRDLIRGVATRSATAYERYNANYVGGDINAGATNLGQLLARPRLSPTPWATPLPHVFLCSSATAPGPGVHGMAGSLAAKTMLRRRFGSLR